MTVADAQHDLKYLPVDLLVPNSWNPQDQDEVTFQRLVDEVKPDSTGFIDVVQVVAMEDGTYRILGGEHRWMAAKAADIEEVPCIVLQGEKWKDEDLQKFVTVRLNTIRGKIDPEKFLKLYREMAEKYGTEALQGLMGYTDQKAFQRLVDGVKKGMRKSLPKDMSDEFEAKAKEAKTVEDLQKIIQTLFTKYGDTVKHSFMIFTHGKQEHIYITMDRKMVRAMTKVAEYCKLTGADINEFMAPITNEYMKEATKRLAAEKKDQEAPDPLLNEPENTDTSRSR
jgi:ParB-like chromosome segregation protein Spo0J